MKHLFILLLLLTTNAFAQGALGVYAVVKDKDGYVNVRAKESAKSKIVGTLPNNALVSVFFLADDEETPLNWIAVDKGYVHKSRLKKIEEFPTVGKAKEEADNSLSITGKGFSVTFTSQKFDETKHKITKKKHKLGYEEYVIDGKTGAGLNGDQYLPKNHYKSITVTINGKNVPIPKSAYDDLYEVAIFEPNYTVYYDKEDDIFYIVGTHGNDSYMYEVCWQIEKGVYKTRVIGQSL